MGIKFLDQKKLIGFKLETTPYTAETLASVDYFLRAENIKVSHNVDSLERKHSVGTFAKEENITGKQAGEVSFRTYLSPASTVSVAPSVFNVIKACGFEQTTHGATGISIRSNSQYGRVPATIEIQTLQEGLNPKALVTKLGGCVGDVSIIADSVGSPVALDFTFKGVLVDCSTVASGSVKVFTPTATDTKPPAVLSSTITAHGQVMDCDKITIKTGNDVQLALDPAKTSGFEGGHIVDRTPTVTIDPYWMDGATYDWFEKMLDMTTADITWVVGSTVPLTISADKCQQVKAPEMGERNRMVTSSFEFKVLGKSADSYEGEIEILQGSKV